MTVTPLQLATIEQWASSSYTGEDRVVVRGKGTHVHVEERWVRPDGRSASRTIVRLRILPATGAWTVHRATASGRWIADDQLTGTLTDVLDGIQLGDLPGREE